MKKYPLFDGLFLKNFLSFCFAEKQIGLTTYKYHVTSILFLGFV